MSLKHVYICGAKGISQYGGFESFVQNLLQHSVVYEDIKYHVACKANGQGAMNLSQLSGATEERDNHFSYYNSDCFFIPVPTFLGSAQAIFYDIASVKEVCRQICMNKIENPVVYILTCRIGPFIKKYVKKIHKSGGKVYLNPDGHEWARRKWSKWVRKYWKLSEKMMVKYADHIVCDNKQIEKYIKEEYIRYNPDTSFIPYGSDITPSKLSDDDYRYTDWLETVRVKPDQYYLVVGRFVEENNFDIIIREFIKSKTKKKLVILTTINAKLKRRLNKELNYESDERIVLAVPIYDVELLKKIREHAYAYIHGHEVGGTNPSLLEGLASTNLNLVLGVRFNCEVAGNTVFYWDKERGDLAKLINEIDVISDSNCSELGKATKTHVSSYYNWENVASAYRELMTH